MPMEAPSSRIWAITRSAAKNSATWCITSAAETSFASCLLESQDVNEYAFALGALSHYAADITGHPRS